MGLFSSKKETTVATDIFNETTVNVNPNIGVDIDVAGLGDILSEGQKQSSGQIAGALDGAGQSLQAVGGDIGEAIRSVGTGFNLEGSAGLLAIGLTASAGLIAVAIAR